jgi:hypothetical protein
MSDQPTAELKKQNCLQVGQHAASSLRKDFFYGLVSFPAHPAGERKLWVELEVRNLTPSVR